MSVTHSKAIGKKAIIDSDVSNNHGTTADNRYTKTSFQTTQKKNP